MNYAIGHSFNVDDLFYNFDCKRLDMTCADCAKITNDEHRDRLAKKIFRAGVKLVLNDVIDNNVTFEFVQGKASANIHVKRTSGDDFKKAWCNGKWQDVDYLSSNFSGNELVFEITSGDRTRTKTIYVDKKLKNKLTQNTNNGKQYC